jgi:hypothetical protein
VEFHDAERGDPGEGSRTVEYERGRTYSSSGELPPPLREIVRMADGAHIQFGPNAGFDVHETVEDAYIYCVTDHFNAAVMASFGGACVRIANPYVFFQELDTGLRAYSTTGVSPVAHGIVAACEYGPLTISGAHVDRLHPCLLKAEMYAHQREIRAVWETTSTPIDALSLEVRFSKYIIERIA